MARLQVQNGCSHVTAWQAAGRALLAGTEEAVILKKVVDDVRVSQSRTPALLHHPIQVGLASRMAGEDGFEAASQG